jgi:hypothetical protein
MTTNADMIAVKALFRAMFAQIDDEAIAELRDGAVDVIQSGSAYPDEMKSEAISAVENILDMAG